jgi:hypothetical protein
MYISQLVCYLDAGLGKAIPDFNVGRVLIVLRYDTSDSAGLHNNPAG